MTILHPRPVSTRQLLYLGADRMFVGEISSTRGFGQVYDDACDEGLTLVSARTGTEVTFVVNETHRDADGDIIQWVLVPAEVAEVDPEDCPDLNGVRITLFND